MFAKNQLALIHPMEKLVRRLGRAAPDSANVPPSQGFTQFQTVLLAKEPLIHAEWLMDMPLCGALNLKRNRMQVCARDRACEVRQLLVGKVVLQAAVPHNPRIKPTRSARCARSACG